MKHLLTNPQQAKQIVDRLWLQQIKPETYAGHQLTIEVKPATRSTAQNSRMWAMLTEISQQVDWYGRKLTPDDWKNVFTASVRKLVAVPNIDNTGFVALGMHTSTMSIAEMGELMQVMEAFGAEHDVRFSAAEYA